MIPKNIEEKEPYPIIKNGQMTEPMLVIEQGYKSDRVLKLKEILGIKENDCEFGIFSISDDGINYIDLFDTLLAMAKRIQVLESGGQND